MPERVDIMIPTLRTLDEVQPQIDAIEANTPEPHRLIVSCQPISASINRNLCLAWAWSEILVAIDDDIEGFYPGWLTDLTSPLHERPDIAIVSARLLKANGSPGFMCNNTYDLSVDIGWIMPGPDCVLPTAAVAFVNWGLRFDENFVGSGFEDGDFAFQYLRSDRGVRFAVTNRCKLVHRNEEKNQKGRFWGRNRKYFWLKWYGCDPP